MKKKLLPMLTLCLALLASCSKSNSEDAGKTDPEAIAGASRQELEQAINDRDQLLELMGDIQNSINQIKELENIVTVDGAETPDQRQQIKNDIAEIQKTLNDRRAKLDELQKKLSASSLNNSNMQKTIETLRAQIEQQTAEIERLNTELTEAKKHIANLDNQVDSLNTTVNNVTTERNAAQEQSVALGNELNTCYVAIGSTKELKAHKILESGFLRKTKIMNGDFDQNFFSRKDKRTLSTISLHSSKAQVLTNQPKDSYTITDVNGQKVLNITNPDRFWSLTNYLVVKID